MIYSQAYNHTMRTFAKQRTAMKNERLPRSLLWCILYASLIITVPQYVACEDLYPGEVLDLFGIPSSSLCSSSSLKYRPSVATLSDLNGVSVKCHQPGNPYVELVTSEPVLLVILRC